MPPTTGPGRTILPDSRQGPAADDEAASALPEHVEAQAWLRARIAALALPPAQGRAENVPAPDVAENLSGGWLAPERALDFGADWFHCLHPVVNPTAVLPESVQVRAIRLRESFMADLRGWAIRGCELREHIGSGGFQATRPHRRESTDRLSSVDCH